MRKILQTFIYVFICILLSTNLAFASETIRGYNADSWFEKGIGYLFERKYDEAIEAFTFVIELDDVKDPAAYNNRGFAYNLKGLNKKALADFIKADKIYPEDPTAKYNIGIMYFYDNNINKARYYFTKVAELFPLKLGEVSERYCKNPNLHGTFYNNVKYDQDIVYWTNRIKDRPEDAQNYIMRGVTFSYMGKHAKAIKDYTKSLEITPRNSDVYINLGESYRHQKKYDKAIEKYNKAIELDVRNSLAYSNRAEVYLLKGMIQNAQKDFEKTVELEPFNMFYQLKLAFLYDEIDLKDRAVESYKAFILLAKKQNSMQILLDFVNSRIIQLESDIKNERHFFGKK